MKDEDKTQKQLIKELAELRQRIADLKKPESELNRLQEELRKTEQEKTAILDSMSELILYHDTRMRILWANKAAGESVGVDPQQLVGHHCYEIWHQRRKTCVGCPVVKARKSGQPQEAEITSPDGRVWFVRGYPVRGKKGNIAGLVEIVLEITDRKQTTEALRESEERFRKFADEATFEGIIIHDEGKILDVNKQFLTMYGYERTELMGMDSLETIAPESREIALKHVQEGYEKPYEAVALKKDGSTFPIEIRAKTIPFHGKMVRAAAVRDITERKHAEEELKRSYEQLQETLLTTVNALASMVEMKDRYTAGHQPRVAQLACAIAGEMRLSEEQFDGLHMAGLVHDIGKIMVPAEILSKPGPLNEIQYDMVKMHPQAGYDILKGIKFPWPVAQIVLQHHERMDGSGYPQGLPGNDILLEARILAVADVVEAMTSHRPYRPAHHIGEALQEISQHKGVLYDPDVVNACLKLFNKKRFTFD